MTPKLQFDDTHIAELKAEFEATKCIFLPNFVEPKTLQILLSKIEKTGFQTKFEGRESEKFGKVFFIPQESPLVFTFNMLFTAPPLYTFLEKVTGCTPIHNFVGRLHRSEGGEDHFIDWHGDNADNRLLAMTLSLGTDRYKGGFFQMREKDSGKILREFGQIEAGDAFIFKIAPELQHRLTVVSEGRRTAGVGWFRAKSN
jgi:2OG-Fe(II) oxygenase superfamily